MGGLILPREAHLRLMHQIGALHGNVLLKLRQDGLAHAQFLEGFFVRACEKVLIVRG